jgi:hypothetical protein
MSKKNAGYIVSYTDKDGNEKKGVVRQADQNNVLMGKGKLLIRQCDDNYNVDEKADLIVKSADRVTAIHGFID